MSSVSIRQMLQQGCDDIMSALAEKLAAKGEQIVRTALSEKDYGGFTGNAQTSYVALVYKDGEIIGETNSGDSQPSPIFRKIKNREVVYLYEPYEGEERTVQGKEEIERDYSAQTIGDISLLKPMNNGVTLRMAVGVEYHEHLEGGDPVAIMHDVASKINEADLRI